MSALNPPGFQERVDELMRAGALFGAAVLRARVEFLGAPPPIIVPVPDRARAARLAAAEKRAERQRIAHRRSERSRAATEAKRAHWAGQR